MKTSKKHEHVGQVMLPGDRVLATLPPSGKLRLGPGLQVTGQTPSAVIATQLGVLSQTKSGKLWIKSQQKRYVPATDEAVVGIVQDRNAEAFLVDINGSCFAELPVTSFENVTKRNVPPLTPGDLVHARITSTYPFSHPTLSCVDRHGKAAGMGVLHGGTVTHVTTAFARSLLSTPLHPVLSLLGQHIRFEIVVGMNGLIWLSTATVPHLLFLTHVLSQCDGQDRASAKALCEEQLKDQQL